MAASRSFFSLISDWNTFSNGCCLSAKQFYACALHKRMKPCREQRKTNSQFRTYFCTASFHPYNRSITPTAHAFSRSGAVFRRTAFNTMEHGQKAHPPLVGRTGKAGTHRHLPFKGSVRDDISMPVAMDGKGWQRSF